VNDEYMDLDRFAAAGESGVLLLMSDSTNSDIPGITPSEKTVGATFDKVFGSATGRIIVASFASNIHRIQQVIDTAKKYGRKVTLSGHSMQVVASKARQRGFLKCASSDLIDLEEIKDVHDDKLVVMTTGSQGEPMSALARMGRGEHQHVKITKGDTVLISAIAIPGNEKYVDQTIDNLFRRGAEVIYEERLGVHVSGHGAEEELKLMLSLVRPRFFIPIHGEYRHLVRHTKLAHQVGLKPVNTLVAENGDIIEFSRDSMKKIKNTNADPVMITGRRISNIGRAVMRERKILAEEGIIYITVVLSKKGRVVLGFPEINTNGFVFVKESEKLMSKIKEIVMQTLGKAAGQDLSQIKTQIKEDLGKYLAHAEHRHPTIVPVVVEV
jgi:ribonuclease J